jgi:hypothetical protein
MKRMGIQALYRRPRTTKPEPGHKIYPYLLRDLEIMRPNQVWQWISDHAPLAELGHQQVKAAKLQVAAEYGSDPLGLSLIDGDLAAVGVIAKRDHPSDPKSFPLGSGNLVPDPFRGDLARTERMTAARSASAGPLRLSC